MKPSILDLFLADGHDLKKVVTQMVANIQARARGAGVKTDS
jgi:hypothetical protein